MTRAPGKATALLLAAPLSCFALPHSARPLSYRHSAIERPRNYLPVEPGNARLRDLLAETVGRGMSRLLWLPPSLPVSDSLIQNRPPLTFQRSVTRDCFFFAASNQSVP